mmetsp:Transcript_38625/g.58790  ORF Transcript_38625/g.58790 Transcript_38625/m.58790 type:complete len:114 (-) Transcript_38625:1325-1666(-)
MSEDSLLQKNNMDNSINNELGTLANSEEQRVKPGPIHVQMIEKQKFEAFKPEIKATLKGRLDKRYSKEDEVDKIQKRFLAQQRQRALNKHKNELSALSRFLLESQFSTVTKDQ